MAITATLWRSPPEVYAALLVYGAGRALVALWDGGTRVQAPPGATLPRRFEKRMAKRLAAA